MNYNKADYESNSGALKLSYKNFEDDASNSSTSDYWPYLKNGLLAHVESSSRKTEIRTDNVASQSTKAFQEKQPVTLQPGSDFMRLL